MSARRARDTTAWIVVAVLSAGCAAPTYHAVAGGGPSDVAGEPAWTRSEDVALAPALRPAAPAALQGGATSEFFVTLGQRTLEDSVAWEQIDEPIALGLEFASRSAGSPLGFEAGLQIAGDSTTIAGVDVTDTFVEFYGGGRLTADLGSQGRFHPYVGAGVTFLFADVTGEVSGLEVSDDDATLGFYAHGGVYFRVGASFAIGVDGRLVRGTDVDLFGIATDADYNQLALLLGWSF